MRAINHMKTKMTAYQTTTAPRFRRIPVSRT
jgi:hypothetical protein